MSGRRECFTNELGLESIRSLIEAPRLARDFPQLIERGTEHFLKHGDGAAYLETISRLLVPDQLKQTLHTDAPAVYAEGNIDPEVVQSLVSGVRSLMPWKKGPFDILGTYIDAEWRSSLKWDRVISQIGDLAGQSVLDVGTGNGYFLLRALGQGAKFALGLEPSIHIAAQYLAISRYFQQSNMGLLPLTCEAFSQHCEAFDTVFSMGVLYHRRSPLDHLSELRGFVKSGGRLVLETIVVDGPLGYSLVPQGRYAQMRNVWFLPSTLTLESWLLRIGMKSIRVGPSVKTSSEEQRSTSFTNQPSLADFLDPCDKNKTIEGYPAPERVVITCTAP